ncbi:bis-tetraphosphatase [Aureobasidium sp. EXF-8845]|nr:bis-tetraphosphatase [Aureobasidium sp. EXF-8845]KAI4847194.1 bis-tetraphosphatase [Aureobasidium sp. EXF-8846]
MPPSLIAKAIHFGPFAVTSQVFYRTPLSFCLVNLKPLLPGHILVCPLRRVAHLSDLSTHEVSDLFSTVQLCTRTLKRVYKATACNIAIQDGVAAGQSVRHVHAHVIPRCEKDMDERGGGDVLYEMLEGEEGDVGAWQQKRQEEEGQRKGKFPKVEDEKRVSRGMEEMEREARWLAEEILKDVGGGGKDEASL